MTTTTKLALLDDVDLHDDGSATVHSASDPTRHYRIVEGTCDCRDFAQAPEHLCAHRLAAGLVRKAKELVPQSPPVETERVSPPLPEAPASVNCYIAMEGRQIQLTLRDNDEGRLLARLQTVLAQYPVQPAPPAPSQPLGQSEDWCGKHGVTMKWNEGKEGRKGWYSHRTDDGWCKGR